MSSDSELVQWHKLWDDNNIASRQAVPVMMIGTESKTLIGILSFKMILIKLRIQLYIIYLSIYTEYKSDLSLYDEFFPSVYCLQTTISQCCKAQSPYALTSPLHELTTRASLLQNSYILTMSIPQCHIVLIPLSCPQFN